MPQLGKRETEHFGLFGIQKEGAQFCFGGGCGDELENCARDVNGTVELDGRAVAWDAAQEEVAAGAAAGFWSREVRGVGMDVENHIRGVVSNLGVGIGGHVI